MKVLVTGGAGFIGSHIVDLLIEEGHAVVVVDNLVTGNRTNVNSQSKFYEVDILDAQFEKIVEQELPEVIIHQAALVYVQQSIKDPISDGRVNVLGTLNVLRCAQLHGVRKIIYSSTCAVYGEPQALGIEENHPINPMSFYGASKYMGESYIHLFHELYKLDYTIFRYANVYGPRQCQHGEGGVIPIFIEKMLKSDPPSVFGNGEQTRDFIYVKDIAKANLLALQAGSSQTYNLGTGIGTSVNDLHKVLEQIMGISVPAQFMPERMGDVKHCYLNPAKATKDLDWKPEYMLPAGLQETVEFYHTEDEVSELNEDTQAKKVAVVMGVYNAEAYLKETLESILAQTYKNLQIIIVNDGSTDGTGEILNQLTDPRVKIINLVKNQGVANALNIAVQHADTEWIAIHDSDDISLPQRIEQQVKYVETHPDVVAVGSFIECIKGNDIPDSRLSGMKTLERYKNSIITHEQIRVDLFKGCPITHGSLLILKEAFLKVGAYDSQYKIASDYDLFMRLAAEGPIENIPEVLYKYRISANSLSNHNVAETSNEFLMSVTKYIRCFCFGRKPERPRVMVCGTDVGAEVFTELMAQTGNLQVQKKQSKYRKGQLKKALKEFKKGRLDAFVILNNTPQENKIIRYLTKKGLELNKDFFTLWSAR